MNRLLRTVRQRFPGVGKGTHSDLLLVSFLVLFLELACIRWFPAHVLFLSFFTNVVLLASFLGISLGCLSAQSERNLLVWTPGLLMLAFLLAGILESTADWTRTVTDVGHQQDPQMVFFGTETLHRELAPTVIPVEAFCGLFFVLIALAMLGPGQELGRALRRIPDRVQGYSINISGSILGVVGFAALSWAALPPFAWFTAVAVVLLYLFRRHQLLRRSPWRRTHVLIVLLLPVASQVKTIDFPIDLNPGYETRWSPYYRVDYAPGQRSIQVNLIGHQGMQATDSPFAEGAAYSFPYLFQRDAAGRAFDDVLVIGAGSGNDVSRALLWGARHVDAVEIDPAILSLGERWHPNQPYADPRVTQHLDDGRNFLRKTDARYDLIVFALVDSLILHSGYSNIRLESFLFTREAFADVRARLKPGGVFVVYNYFRQGWIIGKIDRLLTETFGAAPLAFSFPHQDTIDAGTLQNGAFTMFLAGDTLRIRDAFDRADAYFMDPGRSPTPETPSGFDAQRKRLPSGNSLPLRLSRVVTDPAMRVPTDDWPFLYLQRPMLPDLSLRGIAVMTLLSWVLLGLFQNFANREEKAACRVFSPRFFFLGAGFMLIESKAVVQMALLLGSTWIVNSVVFLAILLIILAANGVAKRIEHVSVRALYCALFICLIANAAIPLDLLLPLGRSLQIVLASALLAAPMFFAGVIFARSFSDSHNPNTALGFNLAGAMVGGFTEYGSMLLGFQSLSVVVLAFYLLSIPTTVSIRWRDTR